MVKEVLNVERKRKKIQYEILYEIMVFIITSIELAKNGFSYVKFKK